MNQAREVARILRVIYGKSAADHATEVRALQAYALNPGPDSMGVLDALGLEQVVRAALIDMIALPEVGKLASAGQYATEIQARAYAVAMIQMAGRLLAWNEAEYRPHRERAAHLASMYRKKCAEADLHLTALRARAAVPANSVDPYQDWKRGKAVEWAA